MPTRLIHRAIRNTLHRWPAKLVLLGYVWMCCGGTIPASLLMTAELAKSVGEKDRSVPFPCMDKACGCRNAEQCYKSCCCSSKAERLAWAKEHRVPAEYQALAAEAEEKPAEIKSCCSAKATPTCCQPVTKPASCCEKSATKKPCCEQQPGPARSKQRPAHGFSMLAAMKCAGLQVGVLGVPLSLPVSFELPQVFDAPSLGVVPQDTPCFSSPAYTPATPPPNGILA